MTNNLTTAERAKVREVLAEVTDRIKGITPPKNPADEAFDAYHVPMPALRKAAALLAEMQSDTERETDRSVTIGRLRKILLWVVDNVSENHYDVEAAELYHALAEIEAEAERERVEWTDKPAETSGDYLYWHPIYNKLPTVEKLVAGRKMLNGGKRSTQQISNPNSLAAPPAPEGE